MLYHYVEQGGVAFADFVFGARGLHSNYKWYYDIWELLKYEK